MGSPRPARAEDAEQIAAIMIGNWRATYAGQLPAEFLASLTLVTQAGRWRERILRPGIEVLVAGEEEIVGFVASGPSTDPDLEPARVHQIYNLHVKDQCRGTGIGRQLLEAAAEGGRELGRTTLCLWVVPENRTARRFYERAGLAADGARQREEVGPGAVLEELRYRGPIELRP